MNILMKFKLLSETQLVLRYISSGLWNTLFAWLTFVSIWYLGKSFAPLWVLGIFAHFIATTQSFFVQRIWVFRPQEGNLFIQYFRFQWVYLGLLGVGLLMLQALYVQGLHPLVAQVFVMAAQAFSGFALGRSFTFSHEVLSLRQLLLRMLKGIRNNTVLWLVFVLSLLAFHVIFSRPFYSSLTHIGHDFSLAATALLEGKFWLQSNGFIGGLFNPPWFTPAWCGGAAFFADPQAGFYSPLQWLALLFNPFLATQIAAMLFAALAFWGGYALARIIFRWKLHAAAIFAVLGMLNTFMPLRSAVGETGYQPIYLWTLLVLALCWPSIVTMSLWQRIAGPSLAVACILTAWLHFGFAGMMVPAFLGVMLLCIVLVIVDRARMDMVFVRGILGGGGAIILNGSKLYEAASLMHNFPRDFYAMPGFPSLYDSLVASFMALLLPSEWTTYFGMRRLTDVQFPVMPHEWALEFGLGSLLMTLFAGCAWILLSRRRKYNIHSEDIISLRNNRGLPRIILWLGFVLLAILPPLLLWNQGWVRDFLKQIPILNSAAWPMRWIVVYLPLFQWLLALPMQKLLEIIPERCNALVLVVASALMWIGQFMAPVSYYLNPKYQNYDPKNILYGYEQSQRTGQPIPINNIVVVPELRFERNRNDTMIFGGSQGLCYNPIYGYLLESFPQIDRLQSGPILANKGGQSLLYNPACLVHPGVNGCKPGDGFFLDQPDQRVAAENFLARKPFKWNRPWLGDVLAWISQAMFWVIVTWLTLIGWRLLLRELIYKK